MATLFNERKKLTVYIHLAQWLSDYIKVHTNPFNGEKVTKK